MTRTKKLTLACRPNSHFVSLYAATLSRATNLTPQPLDYQRITLLFLSLAHSPVVYFLSKKRLRNTEVGRKNKFSINCRVTFSTSKQPIFHCTTYIMENPLLGVSMHYLCWTDSTASGVVAYIECPPRYFPTTMTISHSQRTIYCC